MRSIGTVVAAVILAGVLAGAEPAPQGVVVQPEKSSLAVSVWPDQAHYVAGQRLQLSVRLSAPAYLYLTHIDGQGRVQLLFPNAYDPEPRLEAGTHTFPGSRYSFLIEGAPGTETVQAIASAVSLDVLGALQAEPPSEAVPFALLGDDPQDVAARVQGVLARAVPDEGWAADWAQFQIVTPAPQRWVVRSFPGEAEVYLDGVFVGLTPEELTVLPPAQAGQSRRVELALVKEGFRTWSAVVRVSVGPKGEVRIQPEAPQGALQLQRRADHTFLDATLQPNVGAAAVEFPPLTLPGQEDLSHVDYQRRPLDGSISANLGGHPAGISTFGFEFGLGGFRLGLGLADTAEDVPEYFDLGAPADLGVERVLNEDPEVEAYLKLTMETGLTGLWVELGAGVVYQARAHLAAPVGSPAHALDVTVLPNGYRTEDVGLSAIAGLAYHAGGLLLQLGFDSHRGVVAGLGVVF